MIRRPPRSTLFPYTSSSDLRQRHVAARAQVVARREPVDGRGRHRERGALLELRDRKSTRLNSSHGYISYAVFCLKKKNRSRRSSWTSNRRRCTMIRTAKPCL